MATTSPEPPAVVNVGACRCPGTPHEDGDTVSLRPKIDLSMGAAAWQAMEMATADPIDMQAAVSLVYLRYGIVAWSFVDEAGLPVPIRGADMERWLPWGDGGKEVIEEADGLYGAELMRPFLRRLATLSPIGPRPDSTSATKSSGRSPRSSSKPSSRSASAGMPSAGPVS
jgi:hypothetical protein